jgi:hypothetical protein
MPSLARIRRRCILERYERLDIELKVDISRKLRDALRAEAIKTGMRQPQLVRRLLGEALATRRVKDGLA